MSLILAVLMAAQADASALIDRLRSDLLEEREEATLALKALGKAAAPALELAAKSEDPEVAGRAGMLLRRMELQASIPPRLARNFPGLEDRLAGGDPAWKDVLLESVEEDRRGSRRHPDLTSDDLGFLLPRALRGCVTAVERRQVCGWIGTYGLRSAIPELLPLLGDADPGVRLTAAHALASLGVKEAVPALVRLLEDPVGNVRARALWALADLEAKDQASRIAPLLVDPERQVRCYAAAGLRRMGAMDVAAAKLRAAQVDPDPAVRVRAIEGLLRVGPRGLLDDLRTLLRDSDEKVRVAALEALGRLEAPKR